MTQAPLPPSPRRARLEATLSNSFELWLAFAGVLSALNFALTPASRAMTTVGGINPTFAWTWTILYAVGSIGILIGLIKLDDRIEVAGLILFAVATMVNATTIIQVRGFDSGSTYVALQFGGLFVASTVRIRNIFKLRKQMHPSRA